MGCGGQWSVGGAFYFDDPSSNPANIKIFFLIYCSKTETSEKEDGVDPVNLKILVIIKILSGTQVGHVLHIFWPKGQRGPIPQSAQEPALVINDVILFENTFDGYLNLFSFYLPAGNGN